MEDELLYKKIKKKLLKELKEIGPHQKIPSRTKLADKNGVTRTTIDRAVSELVGEGYLYTKGGSGTYKSEETHPNNGSGLIRDSWGVIIPDITEDTYPGILRGIEDIASENDINVIICNTDNYIEKQTKYINKLIASRVCGSIIVPAIIGKKDITPLKELGKNMPFVFCNRSINDLGKPLVKSNNFYGGFMATRHLIKQGYEEIAYISHPKYEVSLERFQGYISALTEANICFNKTNVVFEDSFEEENPGYESALSILQNEPRPDAVFAFNDKIAEGVYKATEDLGLQIGKDIGLVGYDNTSICEKFPVKLTSVSFKTYETGVIAAELLLKYMEGELENETRTEFLQPELIIRESCGSAE